MKRPGNAYKQKPLMRTMTNLVVDINFVSYTDDPICITGMNKLMIVFCNKSIDIFMRNTDV